MKKKLFLLLCMFSLVSCYKADPLPERLKTEYELAIPIIDTIVSVGDFIDIDTSSIPPNLLSIPAGTPIHLGEMKFPFYLGDFANTQIVEWIEPKFLLHVGATKATGEILSANLQLYTKQGSVKNFFWLPDYYWVQLGYDPVTVPENPARIDAQQISSATEVFFDLNVKFPRAVYASEVLTTRVRIQLGVIIKLNGEVGIDL